MTFNPQEWQDEQFNLVAGMLASTAWQDVVVPVLDFQINAAVQAMLQDPEQRSGTPKDDNWWRGYVAGLAFSRNHWNDRIKAREMQAATPPEDPPAAGSPYVEGSEPAGEK